MATSRADFIALGLIEKDTKGDVLFVWSYPTVTSEERDLYLRKCPLSWEDAKDAPDLVYGQHRRQWFYIATTKEQTSKLPRVAEVSVVVVGKDFHPEKYNALSRRLLEAYLSSGNPAVMLEVYLAVFTRGKWGASNNQIGSYDLDDFDPRLAYITGSIQDVIIQFGIETILIYTALMLKKRIAVYHSKLRPLQSFTRALPALVWHRQDWSQLFPWVALNDQEITELQNEPFYIAGFTDPAIDARNDIYDILVNLTTSEITIGKHAKETFTMGKLHKDIALFMVQCVDDSEKSHQQMIKDISAKTKDLLNNLRGLATVDAEDQPFITLESLQERSLPAPTTNFLFNLAAAEGMVKV